MNIRGLIYALENRLAAYADGSNRAQIPRQGYITGTPENYPLVVEQMRSFAGGYGVLFLTPNYDLGTREDRRLRLRDMGFSIDFLSKDKSKSSLGVFQNDFFERAQPICLSGWLIHWRRNLLSIPEKTSESKTLAFVRNKQETVARNLIREHFEKRGIDFHALIEERHRHITPPAAAGTSPS